MGRIFETRKATMFARWDKMARTFTRIAKDIVIAVKAGGPSADTNPSLRRVMMRAKAANMPKDRVEAAINRALGVGGEDYQELVYEGYGPHGVPLIVETATDNPTRTIANVRMHFNKGHGSLGTSGSVNYMFKRMGVFRLNPEGLDLETLELELIDHGLQEMGESTGEKGEPQIVARCDFADFGALQSAIEARNITPISAESEYIPNNPVELSDEAANEVLALVARLEEDDDVQKVSHGLA